MSAWIDISIPLAAGITQWPGDPLFCLERTSTLEQGDEANITSLTMCAHTGTHIDAPLHYLASAPSIDALPADALIGPAVITGLDSLGSVRDAERVLLRTQTPGHRWWREPFREDYACLTPSQASDMVKGGVRLVGIDYLSIGNAETHGILLAAGVVILEGLNLSEANNGAHDLVCLPLLLEGADGAPARAVIRPR